MSSAIEPAHRTALKRPALQDVVEWRLCAALVLLLAGIMFFARLGARALWSSEFRWAEIAREMTLTHDYFWPTINGRVYYDKPLGSYWLVVAASKLTGGVNETASRLPCAIAGLLGVALLMMIARRLYDARTAVLAGFILATSFSFVFFSRHASADVETVTGELAALLLFLKFEDRQDGWWVVGLWLVMALTSQTKGLLGFVLPIVVIASFCLLANGWRELGEHVLHGSIATRVRWLVEQNRWFFNWKTPVAIAVGIALYYAPFAISSRVSGSEKGLQMVFRENVVRYFDPFDHRGPIYLYVYVIFALMAPWSAIMPAGLVEAHHRNKKTPNRGDRFALVFFWATFVFFTISGSRRSYYILPILPVGALLVARLMVRDAESKLARRLLIFGYGVIVLAAIMVGAALVPPSRILPSAYATFPPAPDRGLLAIFWILSLIGIFYAIRGWRPERIAISVGIVAYLSCAYIFLFAMPSVEQYRGEKPFGIRVRNQLGSRLDQLAMYKNLGPLFYLNPARPVPEFENVSELMGAVRADNIRWFIVRRRDLPRLDVPTKIEASEATFPWEGTDQVRNKVLLVRVEPEAKD